MSIVVSRSVPVNSLGEVVVQVGVGTQEVTGSLSSGYFPVDSETQRVVMNLPSSGSNDVGDITKLETNNKDNVVGAIN